MNDSSNTPPIDARTTRFAGRKALHSISSVGACRECGRWPLGELVGIRKTSSGIVGFAGVSTCGRVWLCPVCNAKVMASRAMDIGAALTWAHSEGLKVIFGSLTIRHKQGDSLAAIIALQQLAWRHVVSSREWRDLNATATVDHEHEGCTDGCQLEHDHEGCPDDCKRKRDVILTNALGRVGYIRASEITVGGNGWHPHFHPLILWRGTDRAAQAFAGRVAALWVEGVEKHGGEARLEGGQKLELVKGAQIYDALTGYVTKATYDHAALALEAVWSQGKVPETGSASSRKRRRAKGTAAHWALLASVAQGLADEVDMWLELETATRGHRMITWSRGLRGFAHIGEELTDEQIAAQEVGSSEDTVAYLTTEGWMMLRDSPERLGLILSTLSESGWIGVRVLLEAWGIPYQLEANGRRA